MSPSIARRTYNGTRACPQAVRRSLVHSLIVEEAIGPDLFLVGVELWPRFSSDFLRSETASAQSPRAALTLSPRPSGCESAQQSHSRGLHRKRQPEHDRSARLSRAGGCGSGGSVRCEYGQLRLQDGRTVSRSQTGARQSHAFYAEKKRSGQFKGCDAYADFREVLGTKRHRRCRDRRSRSLARLDRHPGRAGRQGHVL